MKHTSGFRKTASFLAACVGITSACICVVLIASEHNSARSKYEIENREARGWEALRQTNPGFYRKSEEAVGSSLENLAEMQDNFWVKLPKTQLVGLLAVGGLGSAAAGYAVTWALMLMGRFGVREFLKYREFRRLRGCPN